MKRFLTFVLAVFALFPTVFLAGCGEKNVGINMSRYFKPTVSYTIYGSSGTMTAELDHFIGNKPDAENQYLSITFTGDNSWIYKMTVEKIEFDVYSNIDDEVQLIVRVSNLRGGDLDGYQEPKFVRGVDVKAGKTSHVTVDVNDYFESYTVNTSVVIEVDGAQHYFANGENTGLKIDIINFVVFGHHEL